MCDPFVTNILLYYVLDFHVCIPTQKCWVQEHLCIENSCLLHIDLLGEWEDHQLLLLVVLELLDVEKLKLQLLLSHRLLLTKNEKY